MNSMTEPQLAPPGAGLPKIELWIARLMFARAFRRGDRNSFNNYFLRERQQVRTLIQICSDEAASRRVLIDRVRGLEDSSRYWSVWMTLDHLRLIHDTITRVIDSLAQGVIPATKVSTAAVKPRPEVTSSVVDDYEKSCDVLLASAARVRDLNTAERFPHPWFGSLNAAGWHALAGVHLSIHRTQIQRIIAGLIRS